MSKEEQIKTSEAESEEEQDKKEERQIRNTLKWALVVVVGLFLIMLFISVGLKGRNLSGIGDAFGILETLFTGLAFAFLIYTADMQRRELRLQRDDLQLTREELKKSAEAHRELVENQKRERRTDKLPFFSEFLMDGHQRIRWKYERNPFRIINVTTLATSNLYHCNNQNQWLWPETNMIGGPMVYLHPLSKDDVKGEFQVQVEFHDIDKNRYSFIIYVYDRKVHPTEPELTA